MPESIPSIAANSWRLSNVDEASWLILVQKGTDADRALTSLVEKTMGATKIEASPKPPAAPSVPIPELSSIGTGIFAIEDCMWVLLIKKGTEADTAITEFMKRNGKKFPRPKA